MNRAPSPHVAPRPELSTQADTRLGDETRAGLRLSAEEIELLRREFDQSRIWRNLLLLETAA